MDFTEQFIQIGNVRIQYYGMIIVSAMILATLVAVNLAKAVKRDPEHVYGALTWAIIPGIIFARLWFVVFPPVTSTNTYVETEHTYAVSVDDLIDADGALIPSFDDTMAFAAVEGDLKDAGFKVGDDVVGVLPPGATTELAISNDASLSAALATLAPTDTVQVTVNRSVPKDRNWYLANFFDLDGGAIAIWSGGLSIFGALLGGGAGAYLYLRKNKLAILPWLDIAAVALPLAQFVGRWANYVNKELFGDLVDKNFFLALRIPEDIGSAALRAAQGLGPNENIITNLLPYSVTNSSGDFFLTFHPLFLYEGLWSLAAFFILLWLFNAHRDRFRPGDFVLIYLVEYSFIRFVLEFMRLEVTLVNGMNLSQVVTGIAFVIAVVLLAYRLMTRKNDTRTYDQIAPKEVVAARQPAKTKKRDGEEAGKPAKKAPKAKLATEPDQPADAETPEASE